MGTKITTKTGSIYEVQEYYEDILTHLSVGDPRFIEFTRLDGGFPKPKIAIAKDEIESVRQVNR